MVDPTISMLLIRLAPVIEKKVRDEVCLLLNSRKEAEKLASKLRMIQELLKSAEKRKYTEPRVKAWLEKIKDAAYEMDDALDEWEMKNLELEMEGSQQQDDVSGLFWEKVSSFIESLCPCFEHSIERRRIARKIKDLNGRLESIKKENDNEFNFLPTLAVERDQNDSQEFITTSYDVDVSEVMGRESDKNNLVSKLLSEEEDSSHHIKVIAIVGTGGLGKSTLGLLAYNDSKVGEHFPLKKWVCVSHPFDGIKIAKEILESLNGSSPNVNEFQTLLEHIEKSILGQRGQRFLLVLDDVWTEDEKKWKPLKMSLSKCCTPGSRILVTTRKERVAKMMGAQIQSLHPLSDSECWSLMSHKAFRGEKKRNHERLEKIGWEIAKKCDGLPLAAITLGSLLHWKDDVDDWNAILNSELWQLEIAGKEIFPPIHLSYNELRPSVKRCFSYCAIYPKDSVIKADTLIRMWMAQGFLSSGSGSGSGEEMERIGREYLKDLAMRSLFENIKVDDLNGHIVSCKMHDVIHDFAQFLTEGECFIVEIDDGKPISCPNARHLAWRGPRISSTDPFLNCNFEKLRTFLSEDHLPPKHVLGTLKGARVLNLSECGLRELPPEIKNLIHLRYLDMSSNHITELPISLCRLYNLQTLILQRCFGLSKLPEEIYKLINLRHLFVNEEFIIFSFPQGLEKLVGLRTLNCFKAGRGRGGSKLGYLKNLNQLEGSLRIIIHEDLNEVSDAIEAQSAELKNKNRLETLVLELMGKVRMDVIEALEPPPELPRLKLRRFGIEFPRWISTSLNSLIALVIYGCSSLPPFPLGNLQSLEKLTIANMTNMKYLGHEFLRTSDGRATAFPKLNWLTFVDCSNWTEWEDIGEEEEIHVMPCLTRLEVHGCPKLKSLPRRLLRRTPLEYLSIAGPKPIIEQCESEKLRAEFLRPKCQVVVDQYRWWEYTP